MTLTFDEAAHEYKLGTRVLPSVTQILKDVGLIDTSHFARDGYAMGRGSFVHKATEMLDLGTLDEDALDPALVGYVQAYKKFRAEFDVTWTAIEQPRHDEMYGFAGTPDRLAHSLVLDIKTGAKSSWHGVQLAAYTKLAGLERHSLVKRLGLYLREDGTYKLERYEARSDFDIFSAALTIYHAKRNK